jgi:hypothetical protein
MKVNFESVGNNALQGSRTYVNHFGAKLLHASLDWGYPKILRQILEYFFKLLLVA